MPIAGPPGDPHLYPHRDAAWAESGQSVLPAFLKEMLAEKIGVDVEIFDPFDGLTVDDKAVDPSVVAQLNTSATVSIGLALRNLEARG